MTLASLRCGEIVCDRRRGDSMQRRAAGDIRAVLVSVRVGGGVTLRVADATATHGLRGGQFREHQPGAAAAAVVPVQPAAPEAVAAELLH